MERSFRKEVQSLRLGAGEVFHGEGILAVTKALLQSGVSYVGGYQGAPVSHVRDVLTDAQVTQAALRRILAHTRRAVRDVGERRRRNDQGP